MLSRRKAENKVLDYIKRVRSSQLAVKCSSFRNLLIFIIHQINRPYGAVDISANLKGAVPKPATQKILLALADKGEVTQKTYGTVFTSLLALLTLFALYAYICANVIRKGHAFRCEPEYSRCAPREQVQRSRGGDGSAQRTQQGTGSGNKGRLNRYVCARAHALSCTRRRMRAAEAYTACICY